MSDKPRRTKADKALGEARVADVLRVILDGCQPFQMSEYVREQESEPGPWQRKEGEKPLSDRQIRRYVKEALGLIADISTEDRGKLLNRHVAMRRAIQARAIAAGELRVALAALDSEAELLGLGDLDTERRIADLERRLSEAEARHGGKQATGRLRA